MPTPKEIEQELKGLAGEIDRAREDISRNKGKLEALDEQLRKFGVEKIEDAEKKIEELKETERSLNEEIQNEYEKLKEQYDW